MSICAVTWKRVLRADTRLLEASRLFRGCCADAWMAGPSNAVCLQCIREPQGMLPSYYPPFYDYTGEPWPEGGKALSLGAVSRRHRYYEVATHIFFDAGLIWSMSTIRRWHGQRADDEDSLELGMWSYGARFIVHRQFTCLKNFASPAEDRNRPVFKLFAKLIISSSAKPPGRHLQPRRSSENPGMVYLPIVLAIFRWQQIMWTILPPGSSGSRSSLLSRCTMVSTAAPITAFLVVTDIFASTLCDEVC